MSESPPTTHMDTHTTIADGITYKIARLEATVEYVVRELGDLRRSQERDFRLLFGVLIVTTLGLAGLIAKGFGWLT